MKFYKHISKERAYLMSCFYDMQSMMKDPSGVTKHWAIPRQDINDDWYLLKPDELECSSIICVFPEVEIVEGDDIEFVDPL
jgi:hypothetical protein